MSFIGWMAVAGVVLLLMALASTYLRRLPLTVSAVYLAIGLALGPGAMDVMRVDLDRDAAVLERLTEIAVILSLFIGGLKLRLPLGHPAWRSAFWLAGPVMVVCIAAVAAFAHLVLGLDLAASLLLGAVLAPTDPVLAGMVSVSDSADHDRLRYGLSGEAGLNDGAAFPFVVLALMLASADAPDTIAEVGAWALHRIVYAVPTALLLGFVLGRALGRFAIGLRSVQRDNESPNDFLALALIVLAYVAAESIGAWGFLAVFAAGVGFRAAELRVVQESPHPEATLDVVPDSAPDVPVHPPAESLLGAASLSADALAQPAIAAGTVVREMLSFGATAERLLEVMLVVVVGCALATHWDLQALAVAAVLFLVVRPLAVEVLLRLAPVTRVQRRLIGWFGIRGIGSIYYVCYALTHGYGGADSERLVDLTLSVVAISIVVHGITTRPALAWYERTLERPRPAGNDAAG